MCYTEDYKAYGELYDKAKTSQTFPILSQGLGPSKISWLSSAIRDISVEKSEKYLFKTFGIFWMPERIPDKLGLIIMAGLSS